MVYDYVPMCNRPNSSFSEPPPRTQKINKLEKNNFDTPK